MVRLCKPVLVSAGCIIGFSLVIWLSVIQFFGPRGDAETKAPTLQPSSTSKLASYIPEFKAVKWNERSTASCLSDATKQLEGTVFSKSQSQNGSLCVALLHRGKHWGDDQQLILQSNAGLNRLPLPKDFTASSVLLVPASPKIKILLGRWNSWYYTRFKIFRWLKSIARPELRPEYGIYDYDLRDNSPRFLESGVLGEISTNGRWLAFERQGSSNNGFASLHIRDMTNGTTRTVLSALYIDPGSGWPLSYRWSGDSNAIFVAISGTPTGSGASNTRFICQADKDICIAVSDEVVK